MRQLCRHVPNDRRLNAPTGREDVNVIKVRSVAKRFVRHPHLFLGLAVALSCAVTAAPLQAQAKGPSKPPAQKQPPAPIGLRSMSSRRATAYGSGTPSMYRQRAYSPTKVRVSSIVRWASQRVNRVTFGLEA